MEDVSKEQADIVATLKARHQVLSTISLTVLQRFAQAEPEHAPHPDAYAHETHSFHTQAPPAARAPSEAARPHRAAGDDAESKAARKPRPKAQPTSTPSAHATIAKKKQVAKPKRVVTKWTPEMDRVIRKSLAKFGWACWSLIAASGKLPLQYTRKMISSRARTIGLTREMFDARKHANNTVHPPHNTDSAVGHTAHDDNVLMIPVASAANNSQHVGGASRPTIHLASPSAHTPAPRPAAPTPAPAPAALPAGRPAAAETTIAPASITAATQAAAAAFASTSVASAADLSGVRPPDRTHQASHIS